MDDPHAGNTQTTTDTLHLDAAALSRRKFLTILGGTSAAAALTTLPGSMLSPALAHDEERRGRRPLTELTAMSATALAAAIRQKRVSSREVVQAYLDRIDQVNPQINAVVQLRHDAALAEADAADAALSRRESKGPLHGVPITIKDLFEVAGVISSAGTWGRRNFIPAQDATAVARLKTAGAIILGLTNTPELGIAITSDNIVYGRTNNPYELGRTPGGSSGGEGAIIAAGGSPFGIGSDAGGSIRIPSHFCGIAGIKPTSGRASRTGHFSGPGGAGDKLWQIGPMSRFVEDLYLGLQIITGGDAGDTNI
jgi:amidase